MTQDEVIDIAKQAGLPEAIIEMTPIAFERFAKLVAAKEREACALICERVYKRMCPEAYENEVGIEAELIRARGKQA
jgi:hypothetical protein